MATFPLYSRPAESYHERPRAFGCPRDGGARKHAGCDLYAPAGTPVLAVEDGVVVRGPYLFYDVVYAVEVKHPSGIVRYGEIAHGSCELKAGDTVSAGQEIARVGKMEHIAQSMLHFELYRGDADGPLTDRRAAGFERRADLVDPTAFLDACAVPA
jgi:murein DD-endopeptidase MepM/ murein hydrolase activator NlpD